MENSPRRRVLILGGGFAGLTVAMELEKKIGHDPPVEVTLVNRENFFLFTPMLHEVAASDLDLETIVNPIRKMLRHVRFFAGEVDQINIGQRRVVVSHGFVQFVDIRAPVISRRETDRPKQSKTVAARIA